MFLGDQSRAIRVGGVDNDVQGEMKFIPPVIEFGDSLDLQQEWPAPTVIVVDGPYGVSGFPGDPPTPVGLGEWYRPHIESWSENALPETTLWFWNTEIGWANVHPVLEANGWEYRTCCVWDKGIGHIAGNVNGRSIRRMPITTEVCVQYVRRVELADATGQMLPIKEWLRSEWKRSGLPLTKTNEACGVKNAATRKYFTQCHLWYFPPAEMMVRLAEYAKVHGAKTDRPYFSLDGVAELTEEEWSRQRAKWNHEHGVTNVWQEPALRNDERIRRVANGSKSLHLNQKPLRLMDRIVGATSDPGDIVWEPFGGLCSASIAAGRSGRPAFAAEINPEFYEAALGRVKAWSHGDDVQLALV